MEFAPALFGALIGGLIILILLRQYDRVEPEPVGALLLVGGIGGVIPPYSPNNP